MRTHPNLLLNRPERHVSPIMSKCLLMEAFDWLCVCDASVFLSLDGEQKNGKTPHLLASVPKEKRTETEIGE